MVLENKEVDKTNNLHPALQHTIMGIMSNGTPKSTAKRAPTAKMWNNVSKKEKQLDYNLKA